MKLTVLLLFTACLQLNARAISQITISENNAPLKKIFRQIEKQTGYLFWYNSVLLDKTSPVTLQVKSASLNETLALCLKDQPLTYSIVDKVIVLKATVAKEKIISPIDITGRITNEKGEPVAGATVMEKGTKKATATDADGNFILSAIDEKATLQITSIGYEALEWKIEGRKQLALTLRMMVNTLDETVVIAYGTTTKRLNTGSVSRVTSEEIERQPVSNPLAALQGRVPGLEISSMSGVPGAAFKVRIRGQSSINANPNVSNRISNDPLIIIDGTPFAPNNTSFNLLGSAATTPQNISSGGFSPLSLINPADIESIEVLKDADATAIYGSRGANGVILITTKQARGGATKINLAMYNGINKVSRWPAQLTTPQYVALRKEALKNDGLIPTVSNASDILSFDSTKFTDFQKLLAGHTALSQDVQLSLTGGTAATNILIGAGLHRETTVFYGSTPTVRGSFHFSLKHTSPNNRLTAQLTGSYSHNKSRLPGSDLTQYLIFVPPTTPELFTADGKLNWLYNGAEVLNPLGYTRVTYVAKTDNLLSDLNVSYTLLPGVVLKSSFGFNTFSNMENNKSTKDAQNPIYNQRGFSQFASSGTSSWIVEPQLTIAKRINKGKLNVLIGATIQQLSANDQSLLGNNYSSDLLLGSISGAATITASNNLNQYKYLAAFARINYNWQDKYLVNLTGRRDGSTRFGPGKQYANFGAAGVGWVFSNEKYLRSWKFLSFGKLRSSYGITGNDQIGNYKFLDSWSSTSRAYQIAGLRPTSLFNPDYSWERNAKFEAALELGMNKDRLLISAAYYISRTGNQLINYTLPIQTGFSTILRNFPAVVRNSGLELSVSNKNIHSKNFSWTSSANITIPENKLVSFPGIEKSSYTTLRVGESLSVLRGYHYLGIDPQKGTYQVEDRNRDGIFSNLDYYSYGNALSSLYGGLQNEFSYKNIHFSFLVEFKKQEGRGFLSALAGLFPGQAYNFPAAILDRWQKPGDIAKFQKYTTSSFEVLQASERFNVSDGMLEDLSYARLKNISFSYSPGSKMLNRLKMKELNCYLRAQNLFIVSKYKLFDPETQNLLILPPLKTIVLGINLTF